MTAYAGTDLCELPHVALVMAGTPQWRGRADPDRLRGGGPDHRLDDRLVLNMARRSVVVVPRPAPHEVDGVQEGLVRDTMTLLPGHPGAGPETGHARRASIKPRRHRGRGFPGTWCSRTPCGTGRGLAVREREPVHEAALGGPGDLQVAIDVRREARWIIQGLPGCVVAPRREEVDGKADLLGLGHDTGRDGATQGGTSGSPAGNPDTMTACTNYAQLDHWRRRARPDNEDRPDTLKLAGWLEACSGSGSGSGGTHVRWSAAGWIRRRRNLLATRKQSPYIR